MLRLHGHSGTNGFPDKVQLHRSVQTQEFIQCEVFTFVSTSLEALWRQFDISM